MTSQQYVSFYAKLSNNDGIWLLIDLLCENGNAGFIQFTEIILSIRSIQKSYFSDVTHVTQR